MGEPTESTSVHDTTVTSIGPGWLPMTLVVVATCIAVLSSLTTWVKTQALDTDEWVTTSSELLADPEIQEELSVYLTDQLFSVVDVAAELELLLPEQLSGLAGPLAGALRGPANEAVDQVLASRRFAELWSAANRFAHEKIVAILRDETSAATSVEDGTVTLELGVIIRSLGESLGLPDSALDRIPPDAGQITLFQSDELASAQTGVQILDFLSWFLFVVVVLLYALAVFLARDRRERMLSTVGIALAIGGVAVLMLRSIGVRAMVELVVQEATNRPIAQIVAELATQRLQELAWTGITFGVLIALFAALLGNHSWAVAVRRALAGFSTSTGAVVAATLLLLLGLLWWSPGQVFDRWVTALTLIALVIGAVVALAMRVRSQFPEATTNDRPVATAPTAGTVE